MGAHRSVGAGSGGHAEPCACLSPCGFGSQGWRRVLQAASGRCQAVAGCGVGPLPLERKERVARTVELRLGLASPAREACGMLQCHQEALKKNRVMLAKQLLLSELMEHMIEKDIITAEMVETIQVCRLYSTTPEP